MKDEEDNDSTLQGQTDAQQLYEGLYDNQQLALHASPAWRVQ